MVLLAILGVMTAQAGGITVVSTIVTSCLVHKVVIQTYVLLVILRK